MAKFLNLLSEQFGMSLSNENAPEKRKRPEFRKQTVHTAKGGVRSCAESERCMRRSNTSERLERRNNTGHNRQVVMTTQDKPVSRVTHKCVICNKEHSIVSCYKFKDMNIREKWEAVKKAKRDVECHIIECYTDTPMKIPRHKGTRGGKEAQITTVSTVNALACAYLKIIPVELHGPRGKVKTTALLDEGSTMTLIEEWMAQKLAPRGRKEELLIEAVGGGKNLPVASLTKLGWVLHGRISGVIKPIKIVNHISTKKEEDKQVDTINSLETGEEKSPKGVNALRKREPLSLPDYGQFSSFKKFLGATTRTLQAVEKFKSLRKSVKGPDDAAEKSVMCSNKVLAKSVKGPDGALDIALLKKAELLIWKFVQDECFYSEIKCLKAGKSVERSSRLSKLSMEIGEDNLLRLNRRLPFKSNLTEESRKPVILDGKHEIV
ncbi:unnamed protein product [Parnassius apollo]|uniref:(apollo) hypothetical protein n=1 Tax=Parnassius apollo TaxID=110799 RepID=A0A8S3XAD1_PARAO|nr:unnamed protein product [Parnassius apollo]